MANLQQDCDILIDQLRAIDNKRLINKLGDLPDVMVDQVKDNIRIIFDLE